MSVFTAAKFAAHVLERGAAIRYESDAALVAAYDGVELAVTFDHVTGRFQNAFSMPTQGEGEPVPHGSVKKAIDALGLPSLYREQAA